MTRHISFSLFISVFFFNASAQKIMHSLGASANLNTQTVKSTNIFTNTTKTETQTLVHGAGDYFIRYNLKETENSSISIGIPVSIGLGSARDPFNDAAGLYVASDVSTGVFYNSGLRSTKENESTFGYFAGGGFSYGYVGLYYDKKTLNINTYGPMLYSGVRFPVKNQVMSIGLFFRYGLETEKLKTFGLKMMRDF
jgi:hypothetical protein